MLGFVVGLLLSFDSYLSETPWNQVPKHATVRYYRVAVNDHYLQIYLLNLQLGIFVKYGLGLHESVVE
jgi:hypothetical protein